MFDDGDVGLGEDDREWSGGWNLPLPIIGGFSTTIKFDYTDTRDRMTFDRVVEVRYLLGDNLDRPSHFGGKCKKRHEDRTFAIWSASGARTVTGETINDLSSYLKVEADKQWLQAKRRGPLRWKEAKTRREMVRRSMSGAMVYPHDRTDDWWGGDLMRHAQEDD